ncbi:D-alanyl-D-alanine carboxypeptidase family protein [Microbacterium sp. CPCC 204701]|uniref:D-alanyl-D-alanine carboxypeptidase family protein n=1 Tax=Microbacterium sp. CPCC 204701 TaxID=2493084 RepID=UPI001F0CA78C|nr:D-alanyl-D-alanine carboxypeptidase [Microbacterium sp. CPCC 204701]
MMDQDYRQGPSMTTHHSPDDLADLAELMSHEQEFAVGRGRVDPRVRRARRRRAGIIVSVVILVILATVGGYTGWALTAPLGSPEGTWSAPQAPTPAAAAIALPTEGASAISISGADAYLGAEASGIWVSSGTDEPRSIASITKLITALVVLDARPLAGVDDPGPTITFSEADHDLYDEYYVLGATIAEMPAGSSMSLRDALATMLIPSASNYAEAISTWAYGSQGAFLRAAREWLAAHGLTGTTIVDPTGIDPRNTSTPSDLIALGKLAAADPVIAKIGGATSFSHPRIGAMSNTNNLLGTEGITGLKTGNLGAGSYNLLYTATLDVGMPERLSVTGVMLGGATRQSLGSDVVGLLTSIREGFHPVPLAARGDLLGSFSTPWGESAEVAVAEHASIFTWSDTPITVTVDTTTPETYADGEVIGTITWTAGPNTTTADVHIVGDIAPPTEWWRLTHPAELLAASETGS